MAEKTYIEQEKALDAISEWLMKALHRENMSSYNEGERAAYRTALSEVAELPTADVRPVVRAHWYWDKDGMDWNIGAWRCSACKAMSPMWWNTDRGSPWYKSGHRFCPNCGAEMMKGEV